jgi:cytochrome c-type biogenesis protein CcmH/NrfF
MKNRWIFLLMILTAVMILVSACSSGASTPTPGGTSSLDGATLVQERCTKCHLLSRVEQSTHTAAQWKTIVNTMISRGAQLTPEEESVVVNYLVANFGK